MAAKIAASRPLLRIDAAFSKTCNARMTSAISVEALRKTFGSLEALRGVDFEISPGEFFGLLGPNGAGKSTLINILAGLTRPSGGTAKVMGHDVVRDYRAARRALGVVPQELVYDPFFTVREALRIQSGYFGLRNNDEWIDEILANLQLSSKADTNMRALSGGMKRRVLIAQALVHRPPVIVLDEPTAGVDVELRQNLWTFVRKLNREGHTIVLTTHYLEEAEALCQRVAILKQGEVISLDTTANLLRAHAGHHARIKLAGTLPAALAARGSRDADGYYKLAFNDYAELERLLAELRAQGAEITDLELVRPDLESVFLDTMVRH